MHSNSGSVFIQPRVFMIDRPTEREGRKNLVQNMGGSIGRQCDNNAHDTVLNLTLIRIYSIK